MRDDDYLWDGQGPVDLEVASFEAKLAGFAHGHLVPAVQPDTRSRTTWAGFWLGAAVAVAVVLAIVSGLRRNDAPEGARPSGTHPELPVTPVTRPRNRVLRHMLVPTPPPPHAVLELAPQPSAAPSGDPPRGRPPRQPRHRPPPQQEPAAVPTDRPEGDRIAGQVLAYGRQIRGCFADESEADPGALLWMRFEVSPTGAVAKPRLERHNLGSDAVADRIGACLAQILRQWTLPSSSRPTSIVAPFVNPVDRRP